MTTQADIQEYLKRKELNYDSLEHGVLAVTFGQGDGTAPFTVYIQGDEGGIVLVVVPYVARPRPECAERLYRMMLALNFEMTRVRFALDAEGDVALMMDIVGEAVGFEAWEEGLTVLCEAVRQWRTVIEGLATQADYQIAQESSKS